MDSPRTLFLDFDGVLMPSPPRAGLTAFVWLPELERLLAPHPDVEIVLHTSWRWHQSVQHMSSFLNTLAPRVLGTTARGPRYTSIMAWVAEHQPRAYIILDDQVSEYPRPVPTELVPCDGTLGIACRQTQARVQSWLERTVR